MNIIFSDNAKSNTDVRKENIEILKNNGFIEGGLSCRSGEMHTRELKTKVQLVFGMRCNIGGKRNKYFSLAKDFENKGFAERYFNNLKPYLKTING